MSIKQRVDFDELKLRVAKLEKQVQELLSRSALPVFQETMPKVKKRNGAQAN